ncbi:MAG: hypothetical protein V4584_06700 [Verrucomicrobiota bacterium]
MSVKEIKEQLATLPRQEQDEVVAYLFHLRHRDDPDYNREMDRRLGDRNAENWLSVEDFEAALDKKGID